MAQKKRGFLRLTDQEQLTELELELQRGRCYEASLRSETLVVQGLQEGEDIFVDPRPAIVEVVLHELIHRRYPRLTEQTVERLAKRLVGHLDEIGKWKWYKNYTRVKKKRKPVDVTDD